MRLAPALPLVAALMFAGCASRDEVNEPRPRDTYATEARTEPELMRAVPDAVAAGGEIEAVFPRGSTRGPGFVLERATDGGWAWWYAISSDTDAPDMVNTFTAEEFVARNFEWSSPAFDSTDPHLIPVPDDAEPGLWRVCTVPRHTWTVCRVRGDDQRVMIAMLFRAPLFIGANARNPGDGAGRRRQHRELDGCSSRSCQGRNRSIGGA